MKLLLADNLEKKRLNNNIHKYITTVFATVVMLFLFISCSKNKVNTVDSFKDRAEVPILRTTDVITMISDSGITRYRITAPEWSIYDQAKEPYWNFPKGIMFERFDGEFQTDAKIISDKAIFYDQKKLWELTGNVKANNLKGEIFESEKLFWDQEQERIYSPVEVAITQPGDKVIYAEGFESDQTMSKYTMTKVTGIFSLKDEAVE